MDFLCPDGVDGAPRLKIAHRGEELTTKSSASWRNAGPAEYRSLVQFTMGTFGGTLNRKLRQLAIIDARIFCPKATYLLVNKNPQQMTVIWPLQLLTGG